MIINITIGKTACAIEVNKDCYIPIIYGINTKEGSPNYGKPTETQLGFCSGDNSFARTVNKLIQATLANETDKVTISDYAQRIQAATDSVLEQLKDWNKLKKLI